MAQCREPVCPCPRTSCSIARLADGDRGPDGRAVAALTLVDHAAGAVRAHLERTALAEHRLSWTAWEVLVTVHAWGGIESRDLAGQVAVSKSTLSGLLDTLTRRGLLTRAPYPGDGRRVLVELTEVGAQVVARAFATVTAAQGDLVDELSDTEMAVLCDAARALLRRVESLRLASSDR